MAVVARDPTLMCVKDHILIQKIGDEKRRHAVVVGIPPANALWVFSPGRSTELEDFSADTLRDAKIAAADWSVRGVFNPRKLEEVEENLTNPVP